MNRNKPDQSGDNSDLLQAVNEVKDSLQKLSGERIESPGMSRIQNTISEFKSNSIKYAKLYQKAKSQIEMYQHAYEIERQRADRNKAMAKHMVERYNTLYNEVYKNIDSMSREQIINQELKQINRELARIISILRKKISRMLPESKRKLIMEDIEDSVELIKSTDLDLMDLSSIMDKLEAKEGEEEVVGKLEQALAKGGEE